MGQVHLRKKITIFFYVNEMTKMIPENNINNKRL